MMQCIARVRQRQLILVKTSVCLRDWSEFSGRDRSLFREQSVWMISVESRNPSTQIYFDVLFLVSRADQRCMNIDIFKHNIAKLPLPLHQIKSDHDQQNVFQLSWRCERYEFFLILMVPCVCLCRLYSCYVHAACGLQSICWRVSKESVDNVDYEASWKRWIRVVSSFVIFCQFVLMKLYFKCAAFTAGIFSCLSAINNDKCCTVIRCRPSLKILSISVAKV